MVRRLRAAFFMPALAVAALAAFLSFYPPAAVQAQFVEQSTYGGTSTGSANAQAITIANYPNNLPGVTLTFIPGFTNNGPATISVTGLTPVAIVRPSSIGNVALSGAELLVGELTCVKYNGTAYQLGCNLDMTKIGATIEFRGPTAPRGTLIEDGSCVSQATYAPLYSVIGTTYGTCAAGSFAVPDSRGTMFAALDNQGANGSAGRITSAGSGCTATAVGICGKENATLNINQIPPFTPSGSITFPATNLGIAGLNVNTYNVSAASPGTALFGSGGGGAGITAQFPQMSASLAGNQIGGGQSHSTLNPISLGRRAIKY
jgi:microcystin-dependent protein